MESWSCRVASALRGIDIGIDARWKIKFHLYCSAHIEILNWVYTIDSQEGALDPLGECRIVGNTLTFKQLSEK